MIKCFKAILCLFIVVRKGCNSWFFFDLWIFIILQEFLHIVGIYLQLLTNLFQGLFLAFFQVNRHMQFRLFRGLRDRLRIRVLFLSFEFSNIVI